MEIQELRKMVKSKSKKAREIQMLGGMPK